MELAFVSSNARDILAKYERRIAQLHNIVEGAEEATAQEIKRIAIALSSGPYTSAWLRAVGRIRGAGLYSTRSPAPPAPAYILNAQTTDTHTVQSLRSAWLVSVTTTDDGTETRITNSAPYFHFLLTGTSTTIARPIIQAILAQARASRSQRIAHAATEATKG